MIIFISLVRHLKTRRLEHLVLLSGDGVKAATHFGDCLDIVTAWLLFSPLSSLLKLTIQYLQTPDESEPWGEEAEFVVWVLSPQQLPIPGTQRLLLSPLRSPFCHYNGAIVQESGG